MRIGMFTDQFYPNISGVVTSIEMLIEGLEALGHQCFIFTSFDESKLSKEQLDLIKQKGNVINFPGRPYPSKGLKDYRYKIFKGKIIKTVKSYNLDLIHVHTDYNISIIARKCHKKLHIPIVHTFHTLWEGYIKYFSPFLDKHFHKLSLWIIKKLFISPASKVASAEIFPTKKLIANEKTYGFGRSKNVYIIPTGIELGKFNIKITDKEKSNLRKQYGLSDSDFVYVYIGRTSREKQIDVVINAFDMSCKGMANAKLLIVGGGPEYDELVSLASSMETREQIKFTGFIKWDDIAKFYQIGDIFVNASQSETQGLTYIEALASGLPVLVQSDPCFDGVIENYYNGIIYDGLEDLVKNMKEILKAPEALKVIKKNTIPSIKKFSKEEYANQVLNVYLNVLEKEMLKKN